MRRGPLRRSSAALVAAVTASFLFACIPGVGGAASPGASGKPDPHTWAVSGMFSDACQCNVFCSCEFADKPTFGHCDDASIIHIQKGHYGGVDLAGQDMIVVTQSPEGKRVIDAVGELNFARIYVGKNTSGTQMQALTKLAIAMFGKIDPTIMSGGKISMDDRTVRADIKVTRSSAGEHWQIPNILDLDYVLMKGGDDKTPIVIHNNPLTAYGFGDVQVGRSKHYSYTTDKVHWEYKDRNASLRPFTMEGKI